MSGLVPSLQDLRPAGRPNFAILMIDTSVLLETNTRILSGRLHAANLVPFDCPILFIDVSGVVRKSRFWYHAE